MSITANGPQLSVLPSAETLAESLSLKEALELVLADLPDTADPGVVVYANVEKARGIQRRLAARLVLQKLLAQQP